MFVDAHNIYFIYTAMLTEYFIILYNITCIDSLKLNIRMIREQTQYNRTE